MALTVQEVTQRINGLGEVMENPITHVNMNGQMMPVDSLQDVTGRSEVVVKDFLDFLEAEGELENELFGDFNAQVRQGEDGQSTLYIEPQNVGSKGAICLDR